ncbi:hypothetical protein FNW02_36580 [Komarekiella sp. 'clone 1']|uniref:Uncharacterized protein n=1 Tax=Komarekiella delphini-convector SJRDD-AB1 TaxID=2593771 RepID=A0AA41BAB9_9NOST|nr:hypothetical protein [Komarekiella delphini-convector]MBD6621086.1 hypothetical protein [Komarekiella delphini-convector SJRDD-AB1]
MHLSDRAIAIIACNTNDYKQILIKQNQLAQAVQELDQQAELLLLISPDQNFVFGTVLSTLESFSTHILLREQKQRSRIVPVIATFEKFAITNFQERSLTGGGIR